MKCVRLVGQGVPVRVTDEEAHQIVEIDKDGEYCPKHVFREWWASCPDENFKAAHFEEFERSRQRAARAAEREPRRAAA